MPPPAAENTWSAVPTTGNMFVMYGLIQPIAENINSLGDISIVVSWFCCCSTNVESMATIGHYRYFRMIVL